jgi:DNA replication protein DnaC
MRQLPNAPGMLALVGLRGCGKTWMGAALIRDFCRVGKRARYARAMDIFRSIKATFGKRGESETDVVDELARPDLLVVDEIQVRSESDWENDVLIDLIDARYAALKSTVVIGNLAPGALVKNIGESITSRLQECGGIIVCNWPSYRANGKAKAAAPPVVDSNSGKYQFTPVMPGATPRRPGWAHTPYCGG